MKRTIQIVLFSIIFFTVQGYFMQTAFAKGIEDTADKRVVQTDEEWLSMVEDMYTIEGKSGEILFENGRLISDNISKIDEQGVSLTEGEYSIKYESSKYEPILFNISKESSIVIKYDDVESVYVKDYDKEKIGYAVNEGNIVLTNSSDGDIWMAVRLEENAEINCHILEKSKMFLVNTHSFESIVEDSGKEDLALPELSKQEDVEMFLSGLNVEGVPSNRITINNPTYDKTFPSLPADWYYDGGDKNYLNGYPMYEIHGTGGSKHIGFCFDPFVQINRPSGAQYPLVTNNLLRTINNGQTLRKMEYVIYYGWTASEKSTYNYYTTQLVLWEILINDGYAKTAPPKDNNDLVHTYGRVPDFTIKKVNITSGDKNYNDRKKVLMDRASALLKGVNFQGGNKIKLRPNETKRIKDLNGAVELMTIIKSLPDGITVKIEGNELVITAGENVKGGKISLQAIPDSAKGETKWYGITQYRSDTQWVGIGEVSNLVNAEIEVEVDDTNIPDIFKYDVDTKTPIPGTVFEVTNKRTGEKTTVTTGNNGGVALGNWKVGDVVQAKEVSVPYPYQLSTEVQELEVKYGQTTDANPINRLFFYNKKMTADFEIDKTGKQFGKAMPNGKYSLKDNIFDITRKSDGVKIKSVATDETGYVKVTGLLPDIYVIKESKASTGYSLNTKSFEIDLSKGADENGVIHGGKLSVENTEKLGRIKINKLGNSFGKDMPTADYSLQGNVFEVFDEKNIVVDTITTDKNGVAITKNLPFGTYKIKEKQASTGYLLNTNSYSVELKEIASSETVSEIDVKNEEVYGKIVVDKIGKDFGKDMPNANYSLQGNVFSIKNVNGQEVGVITTDSSGKATSDKLPLGKYTVEEKQSSKGYIVNKTTFSVELKYNGMTESLVTETVRVENEEVYGKIELNKKGERYGTNLPNANYSLKGNVFELVDSSGKVVRELITDEKGKASSTGILLGSYKLREVKASSGYMVNAKVENIEISYRDDNTKEVTKEVAFTNLEQLVKLSIYKEDVETGESSQGNGSLENAVYGLYKKATKEKVKEVSLKKDGKGKVYGEVTDLPIDTYYWKEIKAPEGYNLNEKEYEVETSWDNTKEPIRVYETIGTDAVIKGNIEITKVGNYDWKSSAWNGVNKKDLEEKPLLEGVEFTLVKEYGDKKALQALKTDVKGKVIFKDIPYGKYKIQETKVPEGYKRVDDFAVEIDNTSEGKTLHYTVENVVKESKVRVVKVDSETGKNIPRVDAGFEVYSDTTGEKLVMEGKETFYTDSKGELDIPTMFAYGKYRLREVKAPEGYVKLKEDVPFEVTGNEENGLIEIKIKNDNQKGRISVNKTVDTPIDVIEKQEEFGNYYDIQYSQQVGIGFEFKVKAMEDIVTPDGTKRLSKGEYLKENGKDVVLVTGENGIAVSSPILYIGKYAIEETKAPSGVVPSKEDILFEISYVGQDLEISDSSVNVENSLQKLNIRLYKNQEEVVKFNKIEEESRIDVDTEYKEATNGQIFSLITKRDIKVGDKVIPMDSSLGYSVVKDGKVDFMDKMLPVGDSVYAVKEIDSGKEHVLNEKEYDFERVPYNNEDYNTVELYEDGMELDQLDLSENTDEEREGGKDRSVKGKDLEFLENEGNEDPHVPVSNVLSRATVCLTKTDSMDSNPIEGVKFELYYRGRIIDEEEVGKESKEVGEIVGEYITDKNGQIKLDNLPSGRYYFKELEALEGYILNENVYDFEISAEDNEKEVEIAVENDREDLSINTLFASKKDGSKKIDLGIDNVLVDEVRINNMKEGHKYYVDTFYINVETKKVVYTDTSVFEGTGDFEQLEKVELQVPKNTFKSGDKLVATHKIYSDEDKTNLVGEEYDLGNKNQTVEFVEHLPITGSHINKTVWITANVMLLLVGGLLVFPLNRKRN